MIADINNTANYYYNRGLEDVNQGNLTAGKESLTLSIQLYASRDALNLLGIIHYIFGEYSEAIHLFQRSVYLHKQDNIASQYLNYLYSSDFMEYIEKYNKGIETIQQEDYKEGKKILTRVFSQHHECLDLYRLIALLYCYEGKHAKGLKLLEEALEIDNGNKFIQKLYSDIQDYTQMNGIIRNIKLRTRFFNGILSCFLILFIGVGVYQFMNFGGQNPDLQEQKTGNYVWKKKDEKTSIDENQPNEIISLGQELEKGEVPQEKKEINPQDFENELMIKMQETGKSLVDELEITDTRDAYAKARTFYEGENYQLALELFTYVAGKPGNKDTYYIVRESIFYSAAVSEKIENYTLAKLYYRLYINQYKNELHYPEALYNYMLVLDGTGEKELAKNMALRIKEDAVDTIYYNSIVKKLLGEDS